MEVIKTAIDGVLIIEPKIFEDARGYFFESFSQREFDEKVGRVNFVVTCPLSLLKMYMELHNNPPFPAWRDGLDEVWN